MSSTSDLTFRHAFVRLVRKELTERGRVDIPHFGKLTVEHHPAELHVEEETNKLIPPRDHIQFELDRAGE